MEFRKATDVFGEGAAVGKDVGMEKVHRETVVPFLSTFAFPESFSFLDFGCGNGWVVQKIAQMSACTRAVGFDGAPATPNRNREERPENISPLEPSEEVAVENESLKGWLLA